jgi:hypothetical protein
MEQNAHAAEVVCAWELSRDSLIVNGLDEQIEKPP